VLLLPVLTFTRPAFLLAFLAISYCRADILYPNFTSASGLTLNGAASTVNGALSVTPDQPYQVGSAWFTDQQDVADAFVTTFQFQLEHSSVPYADGISFGIQNASATSGPGPSNSFAVEFDTYQNTWDPNDNQVVFMSCGPDSPNTTVNNACLLASNPNLPIVLSDGQVHTATITYVPGSMTLSLDGSIVLTSAVDLSAILNLNGKDAWVGFETTTGEYSENNDILNWQFAPVPEPGSASCMVIASAMLVLSARKRNPAVKRRSGGPLVCAERS
jgi:Bacterial lectin